MCNSNIFGDIRFKVRQVTQIYTINIILRYKLHGIQWIPLLVNRLIDYTSSQKKDKFFWPVASENQSAIANTYQCFSRKIVGSAIGGKL